MNSVPIEKRPYQAFVSYGHADKKTVGEVVRWLQDVAGIPTWSDERHLAPSATIATALPDAISQCRAMILVLSEDSIASGWVKEEYSAAIHQRTQFKDYRIVPLRLDDAPVPDFLATTKWIELPDGQLDLASADSLLNGLNFGHGTVDPRGTKDLFVSRTWRNSEAAPADAVCRVLAEGGYRLIGDAKDQEGFRDSKDRVRSIMSSCGAVVAISPHRGQGTTSPYILDEIDMARALKLPYLTIIDEDVEIPSDLVASAISGTGVLVDEVLSNRERQRHILELLEEEYRDPAKPQYAFFATDFPEDDPDRNAYVRQLIERVTEMPCVLGDEIREGQIQHIITDRIANAFFMVADITEDNLNTCIEAGIARGAGTRLHLIARGTRRRPPFMFRDQQVWFYENEVELLGLVHRIVYPYRRRVLNRELG